jgi:hypothetical protein
LYNRISVNMDSVQSRATATSASTATATALYTHIYLFLFLASLVMFCNDVNSMLPNVI